MTDFDFAYDAEKAHKFLSQLTEYNKTPLLERVTNAGQSTLIKNESSRMGLSAFKALGGVYAVGQLLADRLKITASVADLQSTDARKRSKNITFICASAGNHGMAVALGAKLFGARAAIFLSNNVPKSFHEKLNELDAEILIVEGTYEDSVEAAKRAASQPNKILLADSSWKDYSYPPALIMEGYGVLAREARQQLHALNQWPTHVYLQAGVGGMAAAIALQIRKTWPVQPKIIVVEPLVADCLKKSHAAGEITSTAGPQSIMGRLDCKEPSWIAFDILDKTADQYVVVTDQEAVDAAKYSAEQFGIETSPSGAAGIAGWLKSQPSNTHLPFFIISEGPVE